MADALTEEKVASPEHKVDLDTLLETCGELDCGGKIEKVWGKGDYVCDTCGLVVPDEQVIDYRNKRAFTENEKKARNQNAPFLGLATDMDMNVSLSSKQKNMYYRLRKMNRNRSGEEMAYVLAYNCIVRIASQLEIKERVVWFAHELFKKAHKDKLVVGRSIDGLSAASLYYACRELEFLTTIEEIAEYSDLTEKIISRYFGLLADKYSKSKKSPKYSKSKKSPSDQEIKRDMLRAPGALTYLPRFLSSIPYVNKKTKRELDEDEREEMEHKMNEYATKLLKIYGPKDQGKDPKGLAAAAIYLAGCEYNIKATQKILSEITKISEVTIRNRAKELKKYAELVESS
jgi:transcription initiation factor TFIIB